MRQESLERESVIYQDILQQGEATLILRLLAKRFGEIDPELQQPVRALSIEQLELLGEMLLDFGAIADLVTWLNTLEL